MHLIAPDILAEARGLSTGACATAAVVGLLLWLFGWKWHRFWTVLTITIAGGIYGLVSGQAGGGHVIALGLLLAVSSGLLAMELARLIAFAAGGTAVWLAAATIFPNAQAMGIFFLAGGLAGILFYRLWITILTAFVGTMLMAYAGMLLAENHTSFDAAVWASRNGIAASVAVGLFSLLGVAAQGTLTRRKPDPNAEEPVRRKWWRRRRASERDELPPDLRSLRDEFRRKTLE